MVSTSPSSSSLLDDLEALARAWVQQNLRSNARVIANCMPRIAQIHRAGHKHEAIHKALCRAGVNLTYRSYEDCLSRLKFKSYAAGLSQEQGAQPITQPVIKESSKDENPVKFTGPTAVFDALQHAKLVAQKDYSQYVMPKREWKK